jgi:hypothetical protein
VELPGRCTESLVGSIPSSFRATRHRGHRRWRSDDHHQAVAASGTTSWRTASRRRGSSCRADDQGVPRPERRPARTGPEQRPGVRREGCSLSVSLSAPTTSCRWRTSRALVVTRWKGSMSDSRLTSLDASFLEVESATAHRHVFTDGYRRASSARGRSGRHRRRTPLSATRKTIGRAWRCAQVGDSSQPRVFTLVDPWWTPRAMRREMCRQRTERVRARSW